MQAGMLICLCPSLRSDMYPICPALCSPNTTQRWRRQSRIASMFIDRYTDITTFREACLTLLNEDVFHVHAGVLQLELGHARSNFIVMGFVRQGVINSRPASCVLFENHPRHSVSWWISGPGADMRHLAGTMHAGVRHLQGTLLKVTYDTPPIFSSPNHCALYCITGSSRFGTCSGSSTFQVPACSIFTSSSSTNTSPAQVGETDLLPPLLLRISVIELVASFANPPRFPRTPPLPSWTQEGSSPPPAL